MMSAMTAMVRVFIRTPPLVCGRPLAAPDVVLLSRRHRMQPLDRDRTGVPCPSPQLYIERRPP